MPWHLEQLRPAEWDLLEREEHRRLSAALAAVRAEADQVARDAAGAEARGRSRREG